jgi:hypothetical protein
MKEIDRLQKPQSVIKSTWGNQLWDNLSKFSYDVFFYAKNANTAPSNVVYIKTLEDFPKPVNNKITLVTGIRYILANSISTPYSFVLPDFSTIIMEAIEPVSSPLIYTGTDSLFESTDLISFLLHYITVSAPNGSIFDITATTFPELAFVYLSTTIISDVKTLGSFTTCSSYLFDTIITDTGLNLTLNNIAILSLSDAAVYSNKNVANSVLFIVENSITTVQITSNFFEYSSNESLFDFKSDLTINAGINIGVSTILENPLSTGGSVFKSGSKTQRDISIKSSGNSGLSDSTIRTRSVLEGNILTTTISATNTPTPINAIWTNGLNDERMFFQDACTFDGTTDKITTTYTHGLSDDDIVQFWTENGGTLPTGLSIETNYYVITDTATTFQVSATSGGAAIDFTGNGTADQYYRHTTGNNKTVTVYVGLESAAILVLGHLTILGVLAAAKQYDAMIMKRSTTGTFSQVIHGGSVSPTNSKFGNSPFSTIVELEKNEGIAIYVENHTDTTNLIVTDGVSNVIKV